MCINTKKNFGFHFMLTLKQPIAAVVSVLSSRQDRQTLWEQAQVTVYQMKMSEVQLCPLCPSSALS